VTFTRVPNSGQVVAGSQNVSTHRDLIISLAAQHKAPAVYFERYFIMAGGLIFYGPYRARTRAQRSPNLGQPPFYVELVFECLKTNKRSPAIAL
jgi:hypothetical protein